MTSLDKQKITIIEEKPAGELTANFGTMKIIAGRTKTCIKYTQLFKSVTRYN